MKKRDDVIGMAVVRIEEIYEELKARGYDDIKDEDIQKILTFIDFDEFSERLQMKCQSFAFWSIVYACDCAGYPNKNASAEDREMSSLIAQFQMQKA